MISTSSTEFVFFGPIGKQDYCHGLWLDEALSTTLKPLNGIQRNLRGSTRTEHALSSLCFSVVRKNTDWLRHFRLFFWNSWTEFYKVCDLGRSEKQDGREASDWLRHVRLLLWNTCSKFNETWKKQELNVLCQVCVFSGRLKKKRLQHLLVWLSYRLIPQEPLKRIWWNLTRSKYSMFFFRKCIPRENKTHMT